MASQSLTADFELFKKYADDIQRLLEQVASLERANGTLREELATKSGAMNALVSANKEVRDTSQINKEHSTFWENSAKKWEQMHNEKRDKLRQVRSENEELLRKNDELSSKNDELSSKNEELSSENKALLQEMEKLRQRAEKRARGGGAASEDVRGMPEWLDPKATKPWPQCRVMLVHLKTLKLFSVSLLKLTWFNTSVKHGRIVRLALVSQVRGVVG